jgi:hypothetical protein
MADESAGDAGNVEAQAREMGWKPKDQFTGNADSWVDAATYVKRGEQIIPILRSQNKKSQDEVARLRSELEQTKTILAANQETIEGLKQFNAQTALDGLKARKQRVMTEMAEAKRAGNTEQEVQLQDQLTEVNTAIKTAETAAKPKPQGQTSGQPNGQPNQPAAVDPVLQGWMQENAWFGKDPVRTSLAGGIAQQLKADPATAGLVGRPFLDKVAEEVERYMPSNGNRERPDKVSGGGSTAQGGGRIEGGTSYADLPADAKAVCERQGKQFVGPGRAYKTQEEWRKAYAERYFTEPGQLWSVDR